MKRCIYILLVMLLVGMLTGCGAQEKEKEEIHVYYVNAEGNGLLQEVYPMMGVEEAWTKIKERSIIQQDVKMEKYEQSNTRLQLYFSDEYEELKKGTEVLLRAAVVQTMVQLKEVEFVTFYVDGEPLEDMNGNAIGLMRAEDFVQNTGSSIRSYETTDLVLYFGDKQGTALKGVAKNKVRYNVNTTIEKLVVEQLMKGTTASGKQSTVPKTTKLLGVSVKEDICYVNFDSKFSQDSYDLDPNVTIYSIVNSIIANGNVTKVQILIDGASDVTYKNSVDLSRPLEWRGDLIKE